jgi:hypothetical protein
MIALLLSVRDRFICYSDSTQSTLMITYLNDKLIITELIACIFFALYFYFIYLYVFFFFSLLLFYSSSMINLILNSKKIFLKLRSQCYFEKNIRSDTGASGSVLVRYCRKSKILKRCKMYKTINFEGHYRKVGVCTVRKNFIKPNGSSLSFSPIRSVETTIKSAALSS